jgi:hypothetical protein
MKMVMTKLNRRDQIFGGAPAQLAKLVYFLSTRTFLFPHKFCRFFNFVTSESIVHDLKQ